MQYVKHLPKYKTKVRYEGNATIVSLWNTDIVKFDSASITLNHGGFTTVTTKRRMNQVAEFFNLGYRVVQRKGVWSVIVGNNQVIDSQTAFLSRSITFQRAWAQDELLHF